MTRIFSATLLATTLALCVAFTGTAFAADAMGAHTSSQFEGVKANKGTVTHSNENGKTVLTLSDDFVVPDTPDPHWQVVDSKGGVYLLDRLTTKSGAMAGEMKNGNYKKSIALPAYVKDVAKVQIYCAWAETVLGEASFKKALK